MVRGVTFTNKVIPPSSLHYYYRGKTFQYQYILANIYLLFRHKSILHEDQEVAKLPGLLIVKGTYG
ncbi:hypothetical protein JCM17380_07620 [Desulfosporosinus burensis]